MKCVFCGEEVQVGDTVTRNDTCPHCKGELHCCKQCRYYDPHAYNECREVRAERVFDKVRANFCEYFVPIGSSLGPVNRAQQARKALEALFKR